MFYRIKRGKSATVIINTDQIREMYPEKTMVMPEGSRKFKSSLAREVNEGKIKLTGNTIYTVDIIEFNTLVGLLDVK